MLFVGTSIIHPSTEGVFLLCNILDLLIYSKEQEIRRRHNLKTEQGCRLLLLGGKNLCVELLDMLESGTAQTF